MTLRGDGARRLLVDNRDPDARGILHNGSGDAVSAVLADISEDDNGVVTGTVKLSDIESVGKYKGVLAITPGGAGASQIPVTVSVGSSFLWAILAVFFGAGLAYIIRWREQIGQQRKRLQGRLSAAVSRYEKVLAEQPDTPPASFDLTDDIGPPPWNKPVMGEEGIAGLRYRIDEAEQQDKFDELGAEVDAMVLTICRWVQVERAVRHARQEIEVRVPELQGHDIEELKCRDGLATLIDRASRDDVLETCKAYLDNLEGHLRLYEALRAVWQQKQAILWGAGAALVLRIGSGNWTRVVRRSRSVNAAISRTFRPACARRRCACGRSPARLLPRPFTTCRRSCGVASATGKPSSRRTSGRSARGKREW